MPKRGSLSSTPIEYSNRDENGATTSSQRAHNGAVLEVAEDSARADFFNETETPKNAIAGNTEREIESALSEIDAPDEFRDQPRISRESGNAMRQVEFERLFRQWRATGDSRLRDRLILMNRSLVAYLARRFSERGEVSEDLMQQGLIGLINALDNFDIERGARFVTFATPSILGEMRRYLRDCNWGIHIPRRLHDLYSIVNARIETLTQQLDRSPTYLEIARSLDLEVEEVIEVLELTHAAEPVSIDDMAAGNENGAVGASVGDQIGVLDNDLENLDNHASLRTALDNLEPRERQVLELIYFQGHSQVVVGRQLKVSQMNISRLQRRALSNLRELMSKGEF